MNKKEKEQMEQLIELMEENTYVLEDMKQLDFNIHATILLKRILKLDYLRPFEEF